MIGNLRCTVTIDSFLANSKTQNAFLFTVNAIFLHDYPLAVEPGSTPRPLVQKKTWRNSLPTDILSAVSVLVVAQSSSEIPEGLMNNPVLYELSLRYFYLSPYSRYFTSHYSNFTCRFFFNFTSLTRMKYFLWQTHTETCYSRQYKSPSLQTISSQFHSDSCVCPAGLLYC